MNATAPHSRARVSPQIPLSTPARSSVLVVNHPDHVCLALSIGHGRHGHRLSGLHLDNAGRAALLAALLDWRLLPELPDDETSVLIATDDGEVYMGHHDAGHWWFDMSAGTDPRRISRRVYAWAHVPVAPANPNRPKL